MYFNSLVTGNNNEQQHARAYGGAVSAPSAHAHAPLTSVQPRVYPQTVDIQQNTRKRQPSPTREVKMEKRSANEISAESENAVSNVYDTDPIVLSASELNRFPQASPKIIVVQPPPPSSSATFGMGRPSIGSPRRRPPQAAPEFSGPPVLSVRTPVHNLPTQVVVEPEIYKPNVVQQVVQEPLDQRLNTVGSIVQPVSEPPRPQPQPAPPIPNRPRYNLDEERDLELPEPQLPDEPVERLVPKVSQAPGQAPRGGVTKVHMVKYKRAEYEAQYPDRDVLIKTSVGGYSNSYIQTPEQFDFFSFIH